MKISKDIELMDIGILVLISTFVVLLMVICASLVFCLAHDISDVQHTGSACFCSSME